MEDSQEMMAAALGREKPGPSWEFILKPKEWRRTTMGMSNSVVVLNISIWEMSRRHPKNLGKYRLAVELLNSGAVTFGPWFDKKIEAQKYLSECKQKPLFGFDEGYALMEIITEKFRKK